MSDLFIKVTEFISKEADMLDFAEYQEWLGLWEEKGIYVVPIDPEEEDFANTLNYAYDDAKMRKMRVARLESGEAVSSETTHKTVRNVSRFRILEETDTGVIARCAMYVGENRHGKVKTYPADVRYTLTKDGDSFKIAEKVVRLINANDYLSSIGYIL